MNKDKVQTSNFAIKLVLSYALYYILIVPFIVISYEFIELFFEHIHVLNKVDANVIYILIIIYTLLMLTVVPFIIIYYFSNLFRYENLFGIKEKNVYLNLILLPMVGLCIGLFFGNLLSGETLFKNFNFAILFGIYVTLYHLVVPILSSILRQQKNINKQISNGLIKYKDEIFSFLNYSNEKNKDNEKVEDDKKSEYIENIVMKKTTLSTNYSIECKDYISLFFYIFNASVLLGITIKPKENLLIYLFFIIVSIIISIIFRKKEFLIKVEIVNFMCFVPMLFYTIKSDIKVSILMLFIILFVLVISYIRYFYKQQNKIKNNLKELPNQVKIDYFNGFRFVNRKNNEPEVFDEVKKKIKLFKNSKAQYEFINKIDSMKKAVLLNGKFGSGKSHFIKNEIDGKVYDVIFIEIYKSGYKDDLFYYIFKEINKTKIHKSLLRFIPKISINAIEIFKNPTILKYLIFVIMIPIVSNLFLNVELDVSTIIYSSILLLFLFIGLLPHFLIIENNFSVVYRDLYFENIMLNINKEKNLIVFEDIDRLEEKALYDLETIIYYLQDKGIKVLLLGDITNLKHNKEYYEKLFYLENMDNIYTSKDYEPYLIDSLPFFKGKAYLETKLGFRIEEKGGFYKNIVKKVMDQKDILEDEHEEKKGNFFKNIVKKFKNSINIPEKSSEEKIKYVYMKFVKYIVDDYDYQFIKKELKEGLSEEQLNSILEKKEIVEYKIKNQIKETAEYQKFIELVTQEGIYQARSFRFLTGFVDEEMYGFSDKTLSESYKDYCNKMTDNKNSKRIVRERRSKSNFYVK